MKGFIWNTCTTTARSTSLFDASLYTVLPPFPLSDGFEPGQKVTAIVLPPGESLSAIRTSAEAALEQCKLNHRNNGGKGLYNMSIANVCVSSVGIEISEDMDVQFYVEVTDANCDALARDMYAIMCQESDAFIVVRTQW